MARYRAKVPLPNVEAIRFDGKAEPLRKWRRDSDKIWFFEPWDQPPRPYVETDDGQIEARDGHWLVRTPAGVIVMPHDVFRATYEEISDE